MKTLQQKIEEEALRKLLNDIHEVSKDFQDFLASKKGLFNDSISICILDEKQSDYKFHPFLSNLFDSEPIKERIIKFNLERYIDIETDKIFKP